MKQMFVMLAGLVASVGLALAGSPAQVAGTVATNGTALAVPASGSVAFKLQAVVFNAATGTVQTVSAVEGAITNQLATKTVLTGDRMLTVTNAPWLFAGDTVRITTTATNSFGVVLVGETQD